MSRKVFIGTVVVGFALLNAHIADAQNWPTKPVTTIVPFGAGSGPDVLNRNVDNELASKFRQAFIVENRPGANGNIGAAMAAKAAPDGYTLLSVTPGIAVQNKYVYKSMPYEFERDFVPIILMAKAPMLILVNPKLPVHSLPELLAYAKANPGKLTVSSTGVGSQGHITLELLKMLSGAEMTHVPYNSGGQALTDVIGGQVDVAINYVTVTLGPALDGQVRPLAITSKTRLDKLPDIPTLEEVGFPGFESVGWYSLVAPKGTPDAIVSTLNQAINAIIKTEIGKKYIENLAMQPFGGTPDDLLAWIKIENERWGPIMKSAAVPM
jgi:tripartite-type tricarboxylate transporter receptor subunit TctC